MKLRRIITESHISEDKKDQLVKVLFKFYRKSTLNLTPDQIKHIKTTWGTILITPTVKAFPIIGSFMYFSSTERRRIDATPALKTMLGNLGEKPILRDYKRIIAFSHNNRIVEEPTLEDLMLIARLIEPEELCLDSMEMYQKTFSDTKKIVEAKMKQVEKYPNVGGKGSEKDINVDLIALAIVKNVINNFDYHNLRLKKQLIGQIKIKCHSYLKELILNSEKDYSYKLLTGTFKKYYNPHHDYDELLKD